MMSVALWVSVTVICLGCSSDKTPVAPSETVSISRYENKLIRRPGATPEDGKVYVVKEGKKRWVVNASWFPAHGFTFPGDVQEISVAEFDSIPTGEPIQ